jgi:hypothetical protein
MARGGYRMGAGRPRAKTGVRSSRRVTVRLSLAAARLLPAIEARLSLSTSDAINQLIENAGARPAASTGGRRL